MPTTDTRKKPASSEAGSASTTGNQPPSGIPVVYILKQARDYIGQQPMPPRGVMLRGNPLTIRDCRTAARVLGQLMLQEIGWEVFRRGAKDDASFQRLEHEIMAELFPGDPDDWPDLP